MPDKLKHPFFQALLITALLLVACKPTTEKAYEQSFALRAARDIDSAGNTEFARYYIVRAQQEPAARAEAEEFNRRISQRRLRTDDCVEAKRTDLTINQYPRIRHKHLFQMGVCLEEAGDAARALKFYEMAESASSAQPQLFIRRASLRYRTGDTTGAAADFERAVALNRQYPPALLNLALFRIGAGQTDAVRTLLPELKSLKANYSAIIEDALAHQKEITEFLRRQHAK